MARTKRPVKPLATIWEIPDELWARIEPILEADWQPSPNGGQPPADWRPMLDGIIHRLRSGCQWNHLPDRFGSDRTIHRWFQRWCRNGVLEKIWAAMVAECDELGDMAWDWPSADGSMGKARFGGKKVGKNPTDRGKPGTKKSLLVEEHGGPLGVVIDGANVPDCKLLEATIKAVVVARPTPTAAKPQHLCLDKGYDNPIGREAAKSGGHTPHIRRIGEEATPCDAAKGHKPRRWVVERTLGWLNKCRALLVRYDKNWENYRGLLQFACGLLWFRRLHRLQNAQKPVLR